LLVHLCIHEDRSGTLVAHVGVLVVLLQHATDANLNRGENRDSDHWLQTPGWRYHGDSHSFVVSRRDGYHKKYFHWGMETHIRSLVANQMPVGHCGTESHHHCSVEILLGTPLFDCVPDDTCFEMEALAASGWDVGADHDKKSVAMVHPHSDTLGLLLLDRD